MDEKIHIITANRLDDGSVVYFQSEGQWTIDIQQAARINDAELEAHLLEAKKDSKARLVIGIYNFLVAIENGKVLLLSEKEKIRSLHKPTIGPEA